MKPSFPTPLLVIEASSSAGSVALFVNGAVVAERDIAMGPSREDSILPSIAEMLSASGLAPKDVCAVACGSGPGSFTSLRIAAALAKGLAVANNALLFAVPSMLLAAAKLRDKPGAYTLHADALRGERYVAQVHVRESGQLEMSDLVRLTLDETIDRARESRSTLVTMGATPASHDAMALLPHARNAQFLQELWSKFGPVDVASWEPGYGRLAEAQVKWETQHGRALPTH